MHVVFKARMLVDGKPREETLGLVELVDGKVRITPDAFSQWLRKERGNHLVPLDPEDGERYLENLPKVFQNSYLYAVLEQSSGGANPGGAERT